MKILNLAPASLNDKHGIASWFRYYFQGLIESNHEHELYFVSTRNKKGVEKEFTKGYYHFIINWLWIHVEEVLNAEKWDVIHYHTTILNFENPEFEFKFFSKLLELKENGTKIITTTHSLQKKDNSYEFSRCDVLNAELFYNTFSTFIASEHYNTKISELSDVVIYISQNDMKVAKSLGDNFKNCKVIYNSMNIYKDFSIKNNYKTKNIAFSHRWAMRKNWFSLLDIVPINDDKTFHLSGDYFSPLLHMKLLKKDNVRFYGVLDEKGMEKINEVSDIMLCPALYEPFGFTALESVILGTPSLIYKNTGTYEVLGDSSFCFTDDFPIEKALEKFYKTSDEEIKERIDSQQINIKKFGNKTKMVDEYLSLYNEVVQ